MHLLSALCLGNSGRYTTCVIWVAFVPIYFSGNESKTITLCMCVSLSAVVTLVLLFGPKLYIIIFKPEKNNRSAFTTTADLRIHIVGGTVIPFTSSLMSFIYIFNVIP